MTQKKSSNEPEVKEEEVQVAVDGALDGEVKIEGDGIGDIAPAKELEVKEPPKEEAEDVQALRQQIDELKNAQKLREQEALRREQQAQAQYQSQLDSMRQSADQSQYDTIVTAIGAAQMEIDSAKRDIVLSGQAQDFGALADAQERLAAAKAHMVGLEQGKTAYEQQWQAMQQQPRQSSNPVDNIPGLSYEEREWLNEHPEAITDKKQNARLNAAYYDAMDANLRRGSKEYFELIEERLGYREKKVEKAEPEAESSVMVAAPPSNQVPSGAGTGGKKPVYTLTKEEAEIAKLSGITPQEYAKQREAFRAQRKAHPDDYPTG